MTEARVRDGQRLRGLVDQTFDASLAWSRHFTLSLAIGNGGGLLACFNAASQPEGLGLSDLRISAVAFLVGLLSAAVLPKVLAKERGLLSEMTQAAAEWHESAETDFTLAASLKADTDRLHRIQRRASLLEWASGLGFVAGVIWALVRLG